MKTLRSFAAMMGVCALAASILVANTGAASAATVAAEPATTQYTFQRIAFPGDTFTQLLGINDQSVIAGYHGMDVNKGFRLTLPNHYTLENFPGSAQTQVIGINNFRNTGGFYVDSAGNTHGFLDVNGTFSTVDFPGTTFNQILGLNDLGQAAGYYQDANGAFHPYLRQANGTFTALPVPNSQATGINDRGEVSGFSTTGPNNSWGWLLQGHQLTALNFPGSNFTQALGVNYSGVAVGSYTDSAGVTHGFVYQNGSYQSVDYPGATMTVINGINSAGHIVGFYMDAAGNTLGFVGIPS